MTLTLDVRSPIIVLVADFNPAIFQTPWIAKHLFGKEEGEEMSIAEILAMNGSVAMPLTFLDGVAVSVTPSKTELWSLDGEDETLAQVESVLLNMLDALPHTPLTAIGCNLVYTDAEPPERVVDLFTTPEGLEAEGVLNMRQSGVQLQLDDHVLNFARFLTATDARFSFNYHRVQGDQAAYKGFVPGLIKRSREHSSALLKSFYGYEGYDLAGFIAAPSEGGEGKNVEAVA